MDENPWVTEEMQRDMSGGITITRTAQNGDQNVQYIPRGNSNFKWTAADSVAAPSTQDYMDAVAADATAAAEAMRDLTDLINEQKKTGVLAPAKKKPGYSGPSFKEF
jgi:hypothetical protein